jgi:hypothetical protein
MLTNSDMEMNWREAVVEITSRHLLGATEESYKNNSVQILDIPDEIRISAS